MYKKRLIKPLFALAMLCGLINASAEQGTFSPYTTAAEVPKNVIDLWKDYDARKEALKIKVVKEWKDDGVVTRYITFKVGHFKGAESRIAAYYSFPDNGKKNPAFVWSHGGGQNADRSRGHYFAKQGFATVDINWGGREMEKGIEENTDWGNVDPTQGPMFYKKALRKGWNRSVKPDEFSIDAVASPRNNNWFLLAVAARRAITVLEQQPEVDADRIGFSGFSMGGTITSMTSTDPRLKAVAPFVGGTGFLHVDFPTMPRTGLSVHFPNNLEMYINTVDPSAYWPHTKVPVMHISSSNDFHAVLERLYRSADLIPHKNWRVSTTMHDDHGPGAEQWAMLIQWFNQHLKNEDQKIPLTAMAKLDIKGDKASFSVQPDNQYGNLKDVEIYYSYDPNGITRFWKSADATQEGKQWTAEMSVYKDLPIYAFALCRYELDEPVKTKNSETNTITINSNFCSQIPEKVDLAAKKNVVDTDAVFEDFSKGLRDWQVKNGGISTYKFQDPALELSPDKKMVIQLNPQGGKYIMVLSTASRFVQGSKLGHFSCIRMANGDQPVEISVGTSDFKNNDKQELIWDQISTFSVSLTDQTTKAKIDPRSDEFKSVIKSITLK